MTRRLLTISVSLLLVSALVLHEAPLATAVPAATASSSTSSPSSSSSSGSPQAIVVSHVTPVVSDTSSSPSKFDTNSNGDNGDDDDNRIENEFVSQHPLLMGQNPAQISQILKNEGFGSTDRVPAMVYTIPAMDIKPSSSSSFSSTAASETFSNQGQSQTQVQKGQGQQSQVEQGGQQRRQQPELFLPQQLQQQQQYESSAAYPSAYQTDQQAQAQQSPSQKKQTKRSLTSATAGETGIRSGSGGSGSVVCYADSSSKGTLHCNDGTIYKQQLGQQEQLSQHLQLKSRSYLAPSCNGDNGDDYKPKYSKRSSMATGFGASSGFGGPSGFGELGASPSASAFGAGSQFANVFGAGSTPGYGLRTGESFGAFGKTGVTGWPSAASGSSFGANAGFGSSGFGSGWSKYSAGDITDLDSGISNTNSLHEGLSGFDGEDGWAEDGWSKYAVPTPAALPSTASSTTRPASSTMDTNFAGSSVQRFYTGGKPFSYDNTAITQGYQIQGQGQHGQGWDQIQAMGQGQGQGQAQSQYYGARAGSDAHVKSKRTATPASSGYTGDHLPAPGYSTYPAQGQGYGQGLKQGYGHRQGQGYVGVKRAVVGPEGMVAGGPGAGMGQASSPTIVPVPIDIDALVYPDGQVSLIPPGGATGGAGGYGGPSRGYGRGY
ncbi:hypothetical protein EDD11_009042 [Mortierella claussenii]|nr:hypothetical protein EDD11_009042 [Mortierella claussenii]